jgi:hypothetical protein
LFYLLSISSFLGINSVSLINVFLSHTNHDILLSLSLVPYLPPHHKGFAPGTSEPFLGILTTEPKRKDLNTFCWTNCESEVRYSRWPSPIMSRNLSGSEKIEI